MATQAFNTNRPEKVLISAENRAGILSKQGGLDELVAHTADAGCGAFFYHGVIGEAGIRVSALRALPAAFGRQGYIVTSDLRRQPGDEETYGIIGGVRGDLLDPAESGPQLTLTDGRPGVHAYMRANPQSRPFYFFGQNFSPAIERREQEAMAFAKEAQRAVSYRGAGWGTEPLIVASGLTPPGDHLARGVRAELLRRDASVTQKALEHGVGQHDKRLFIDGLAGLALAGARIVRDPATVVLQQTGLDLPNTINVPGELLWPEQLETADARGERLEHIRQWLEKAYGVLNSVLFTGGVVSDVSVTGNGVSVRFSPGQA